MPSRRNELLRRAGLVLGIGLAYALFCGLTGWYLPCPFHAVTGLWCPGCGVSRMCMALLRLDLPAAWRWNPALMVLTVPLGILLARLAGAYVRQGRTRPTWAEQAVIWAMAAFLLVFGVLRNLPGMEALAPG